MYRNKDGIKQYKYSIITPSICRPLLKRTCESINSQTHKNWEHIVMMDMSVRDLTEEQALLLESIQHKNRKIIFCGKKHNNYGNTCRHNAYEWATGDYIFYLDDDDYYKEYAFDMVNKALNEFEKAPEAFVFPAWRHESTFFNIPPGSCMTVTGQYGIKPKVNNEEIRWLSVPEGDLGYCYDGEFLEGVKNHTTFIPICRESRGLVVIEKASHGQ